MPNYTPDPTNENRPQGGDRVQITEELRGLKTRITEEAEKTIQYDLPLQKVHPIGSSGIAVSGNHSIDLGVATYRQIRITGNATLNITAPSTGKNNAVVFGTVRIENGGNHTVNWNSNIRWSQGVQPVLTSDGYDVLVFFQTYPNGPWNGIVSGSNMRVTP